LVFWDLFVKTLELQIYLTGYTFGTNVTKIRKNNHAVISGILEFSA
jgi:hypothetical protein